MNTITANDQPSGIGIEEGIALHEILQIVWRKKKLIALAAVIGLVIGSLYASVKPDLYRSEALLIPVENSTNTNPLGGQLGGLAALAGLTSNTGGGNALVAIETAKSTHFLSKFIVRHELKVPLFASDGFNKATGNLDIDNNKYDVEQSVWLRSGKVAPEPSNLLAVNRLRQYLTIKEDARGFLTVTVEHESPKVAQRWVELLVTDINEHMRAKAVHQAKISIDYLTDQLESTPLSSMQRVFYGLIEDQTKNMLLAEVNPEFIFQTIDPAVVPERPFAPKKLQIVFAFGMLGTFLSIALVLIHSFILKLRS